MTNAQPAARTAHWPLGDHADAVGQARGHLRGFGRADARREALADALLVISELVTNALCHAPGPCSLTLTDDGALLVIAVSDTGTALPRPRQPANESGGFGWHLLRRLSVRVEVYTEVAGGKTIAATVPTPWPSSPS